MRESPELPKTSVDIAEMSNESRLHLIMCISFLFVFSATFSGIDIATNSVRRAVSECVDPNVGRFCEGNHFAQLIDTYNCVIDHEGVRAGKSEVWSEFDQIRRDLCSN